MSARFVLALLAAVVSGAVHAAPTAVPDSFGPVFYKATGATKWTVGFGSDGTPIVAPGVPTLDPDGGAGGPKYSNSGSIPNPAGNRVPVTYTARPSGPAMAKAMGNFLAKMAFPLSAGMAAYDLAKELGFNPLTNADGTQGYEKPSQYPTGCGSPWPSSVRSILQQDPAGGCYGQYGGIHPVVDSVTFTGGSCRVVFHCSNGSNPGSVATWASNGLTTPATPSTQQEFLDAIATKSGWPTTSNIAKALAAAGTQAGEKVDMATSPVTVTVPATSPGTTTTEKVMNPDGSEKTTTKTTTYNHVATGNVITTTTTTVTNVTNNGCSNCNNTTTTEVSEPETSQLEKPKDPCGLPGTPACKIDETGTPTTKELKLDETAITTQANTNKTTISGQADKGFFNDWGALFVTPPVVACSPLTMPASVGGVSLDPCPVVDGARTIMAWLWALAGFWLAVGWVREAI